MDSGSVMTVVFAAQHRNALLSDWCLYRTLAVFLEWLEGARDCRAILKLHPLGAGREHGYELALSEHPELDIEVTREAALHDVLQGADCVASHSSTVLLDAAFLRVPAIVINPFGSDDYIPVVQEGTALRAEDAAGLARAVEAVRSGTAVAPGAYDEAIRRNAFVLDGRAGHRIAELCASLARH